MGSAKFKLNAADLVALGKNASLVGLAAGLTYVVQNIGAVDLGTAGPLVVPIIVVGLDTVIKWLKDNTK